MIDLHQGLAHANVRSVPKDTKTGAPPGIAKQWPTLLMIKLGRITQHRFTEALEPFGIRPRHVAALMELRDRGELTQQSLWDSCISTRPIWLRSSTSSRSGGSPRGDAIPRIAAGTSSRYRRRGS